MKNNFVLAICILVFGINLASSQENKDLYKQLYENNFFITESLNVEEINNNSTNGLKSLVSINQIGNLNNINVTNKLNDSQKIVQIGDRNNYDFIRYYSHEALDLNILQNGNSNSLDIYGENSIIKNISIIQNTNFKALIIKNY